MPTKKKVARKSAKRKARPVAKAADVVAAPPAPVIVPRHQWTHDGDEVLILKCVAENGETYGGFKWPLTVGAVVEPERWVANENCGNGLHGWPWGFSIGDGKEPDWAGTWLVFGAVPADVIDLAGKVKVRRATVRFVGDWIKAANFILDGQMAWVAHAAQGASTATGDRGASTATGYSGASTATGDSGASTATGDSGASTATGYRGASTATGYRGASTATGDSGASTATGNSSVSAVTGLYGRVRGGCYGVIALAFWNAAADRSEMRGAEIGCGDGSDGKLKAHVWYVLDEAGKFVEVEGKV